MLPSPSRSSLITSQAGVQHTESTGSTRHAQMMEAKLERHQIPPAERAGGSAGSVIGLAPSATDAEPRVCIARVIHPGSSSGILFRPRYKINRALKSRKQITRTCRRQRRYHLLLWLSRRTPQPGDQMRKKNQQHYGQVRRLSPVRQARER